MVKLLFGIKVDKKKLFTFGKVGFLITFMAFGIMLLSGVIDKSDDLKSYYNLW